MAYVIAEPCIDTKDTACVEVCPVDCIHPKKDEAEFAAENKLYIDPETCIDCGACVPVCPVQAIFPQEELPEKWQRFTKVDADWYDEQEVARHVSPMPPSDRRRDQRMGLSVPVRVRGHDPDGTPWEEMTATDDASYGGASFPLKHAHGVGQVLYISAPLPRNFRRYDLAEQLVQDLRPRAEHARGDGGSAGGRA